MARYVDYERAFCEGHNDPPRIALGKSIFGLPFSRRPVVNLAETPAH
jgi:hypothetical protein